MIRFWRKKQQRTTRGKPKGNSTHIEQTVDALFRLLHDMYGEERILIRAGKLSAVELMHSSKVEERVLALQRFVFEDSTLSDVPKRAQLETILDEIQERLADELARQTVEDELNERVARRLQERQEQYIHEIREQLVKEQNGPDNAHTLRKYADLEMKEQVHVASSVFERLRPDSVDDVVGQSDAIEALFSKIASPFPQHVILYGPPGVGKTTVARLALEHAKTLPFSAFRKEAPFVEVDGTTLRWDPREATNPLLGSVHDPIYQGASRDFAEHAIPEPKPGLVTEAHGGILFIDEIGELDTMLQNKLLKVLEDRRVHFDSAYYDPDDKNIPKYIRKLFQDGAPADFILVSATTRDPGEINPALRSRCAEVFFDPLTTDDIVNIVRNAAKKMNATLDDDVASLISSYTRQGRQAVSILADAYGYALSKWATQNNVVRMKREMPAIHLTRDDVLHLARLSRLNPRQNIRPSRKPEVGRVLGLGVNGFIGSMLEIEAVAFPAAASGQGTVRFNESAGSMAKDSVFNAASVVRFLTNENLADWDVHVNVVGGGNVDGPSAGAAIVLAIVSALNKQPIRQDVAITGEISIQGRIKPVGGIHEKVHAAAQAGVTHVVIPAENAQETPHIPGVTVQPAKTIEDVLKAFFPKSASTTSHAVAPYLLSSDKRGVSK